MNGGPRNMIMEAILPFEKRSTMVNVCHVRAFQDSKMGAKETAKGEKVLKTQRKLHVPGRLRTQKLRDKISEDRGRRG